MGGSAPLRTEPAATTKALSTLLAWGIVKIMVPFGSPKLGPVLGPVL